MPSTTQVRTPARVPIGPFPGDPTDSVPSLKRNAYHRKLLSAHFTSPSSSIQSPDLLRCVSMFEAETPATPYHRLSVSPATANFGDPVGILHRALDASGEGESWPIVRPEPARARSRAPARKKWLRDAREQLENLDVDALEEGLAPLSAEARHFAERFLLEFAKVDLPLASVFADEHRGVSIQMEVSGFFFLLTCLEGGRGIYNIAHQTYRFGGSYKGLSIGDVAESEFFQHLRCLIKPLTKDARHTDRPE